MSSLQTIKKRFLDLQGKEIDFASKAIQENEEVAVQMVAEQLAQGIKSDGEPANFTYTPLTIAIKKTRSGLAAVTDHLTNYDTGASYRGLYMKVKGAEIDFGTTTDKDEAIDERMEGQAFRPTQKNKEEFLNQFAQPSMNKFIREFVKL
jgi:hypothetical protein